MAITITGHTINFGTHTLEVSAGAAGLSVSQGSGTFQAASFSTFPNFLGTNKSVIYNGSNPGGTVPAIETFPMSTDSVIATSVATPVYAITDTAATENEDYAYSIAGGYPTNPSFSTNIVTRIPFASTPSGMNTIGSVGTSIRTSCGASTPTDAYSLGGYLSPTFGGAATIYSIPFATTPVSDAGSGSLSVATFYARSAHTTDTAWVIGGNTPVGSVDNIEEVPLVTSSASGSLAGNLAVSPVRFVGAWCDGSKVHAAHGYTFTNFVTYFPVASVPAISSSTLSASILRYSVASTASTSHAYSSGGRRYPPTIAPAISTVSKFPFSTSAVDSVDIGNLVNSRGFLNGGSD
jgi:hypothetical protein